MSVAIICNLPTDVQEMMRDKLIEKKETIDKIQSTCHCVRPDTFDWTTANRNTWFVCIDAVNKYSYYFPIAESENRDNAFKRVKEGMEFFLDQGWLAYQIQ